MHRRGRGRRSGTRLGRRRQTAPHRIRRSEGIGHMTKSRKTQRKRAPVLALAVSPAGGAKLSRNAPPPRPASAGESRNREGWVQMSFRAPPAVEEFVMTMCVPRKVTFQTLVLGLLRNVGAPINDVDLRDNRKGRKATAANSDAWQALKSTPLAKRHDAIAALEQLRDPRLWEQIAQLANTKSIGQPALQVIFANFAGDREQ